jgi:predicted Zn-dependent protease
LASHVLEPLGDLLVAAQDAKLATMSIPRQIGTLYGAALAASRQRKFSEAAGLLERLAPLVTAPAGAARQFRLLQTEVALAAGNGPQAMALLRDAPPSMFAIADGAVSARPELVLHARAAIMGRQDAELAKATQSLQAWVAIHPSDALAWQLLATAYGTQGQTMRAIRADAEVRVATLDYAGALDRFKAAQQRVRQTGAGQNAADHIEASILDTRRRQIESLLKEQTLDRGVDQNAER